MIEDRDLALEVSNRMLKINASIDDSIIFVQQHCSVEEIERFKMAMGEVMYKVFEEALIPIYKKHPDLVPKGQRVSGIND
ncbi:hypothetical protein DLM46_14475 [Paraburkholderia lacunae]|uniref:Uncharacterized protein n=2 Tax=Paraburkholderia lacunae TaxID=2211104 RepID=A0A370N941_9BURK|nr:hypothetical protein DLM46_14475 [Paraburkholderia lacunae]